MRKIFFSVLACIFLLTLPALAFSDDFSSGLDLTVWSSSTGTWSATDGNLTKTVGAVDQYIQASVGTASAKHIDAWIYRNPATCNNEYLKIYWKGTTKGLFLNCGFGNGHIDGVGFTLSADNVAPINVGTAGYKFKFEADIIGSNIRIRFYWANGTMFNEYSQAYTDTGTDNIQFAMTTIELWRIDSVVVSAVSPSSSNSITWNEDIYYSGGIGSYSWTVTDAVWGLTTVKAIMFKDGALYNIQSVSPYVYSVLSSQTGTAYFNFGEPGMYLLELWSCPVIPLLGSVCLIELDSVAAQALSVGASTVQAPKSVGVNQNFSINYTWGFVPPSGVSGLKLSRLGEDGKYYQIAFYSGSSFDGNSANIPYSKYVSVPLEGTYKAELIAYGMSSDDIVAVDTFKAFYFAGTPTQNLSNSYISLSKNSYLFGETYSGIYGVDNTNYSTPSGTVIYVSVYNYARQVYTDDTPISGQTGGFWGEYHTFDKLCTGGVCSYMPTGYTTVYSGANKVVLRYKNSTNDIELAYYNFTVSNVNANGDGFELSRSRVCQKEKFFVYVNSSLPKVLNVYKNDSFYMNYSINATLGYSFPLVYSKVGTYEFRFADFIYNLEVVSCESGPTVTGTPPDTLFGKGEVSGDFGYEYKAWIYEKVGKSAVSLFFVGLLHVILFMAVFLAITKAKFPPVAGVGALLALWFNVELGFMDKAVAVVIVVLVGMALVASLRKG